MKFDAALKHFRLVPVASVIEGGLAFHAETHAAAYHFYDPNQAFEVRCRAGRDGHEVDDLAHAIRGQKSRYQDVRVGPVKLPARDFAVDWADPEIAAFFGVEKGGENAGRIKAGKAKPVDRPILRD